MNPQLAAIDFPTDHPLVAYWKLSPAIWLVLAVAWTWVAISIGISFEVPASGAVLVGAALVAEILFEKLTWRSLPCPPDGSFQLLPDGETKRPVGRNQFCFVPFGEGCLGALLSLAPKHTIFVVENSVIWLYKNVATRTQRVFFVAIMVTAIIGTLLWGYGHYVFPPNPSVKTDCGIGGVSPASPPRAAAPYLQR